MLTKINILNLNCTNIQPSLLNAMFGSILEMFSLNIYCVFSESEYPSHLNDVIFGSNSILSFNGSDTFWPWFNMANLLEACFKLWMRVQWFHRWPSWWSPSMRTHLTLLMWGNGRSRFLQEPQPPPNPFLVGTNGEVFKEMAAFPSGESCHPLSRLFARRVGRASGAQNIENCQQCVINYFHNNVHLSCTTHREYLV